ncbi:MAG: class II fumarate hydratase [Mycoplasmataceae bacterium]|nr:class II fumarate hydratase [Mycoplasmataceae bacterium]
MKYRIEKDSIGEIKVDDTKYWGAQTQRSLQNFVISNEIMPKTLIRAITAIKIAAAQTNYTLKWMDQRRMKAIVQAGKIIFIGRLDDQFPLKIWQTGSGTQTNMNVNEVIANYANKQLRQNLIHPNDHVNMSQSSNDVFPTAIHVALIEVVVKQLLPSLEQLINSFKKLEQRFKDIIKIGRTHLQDATPILLSQEISGWRSSLENCKLQIVNSLSSLYELPLGGTAVGTGLNAPKGFDSKAIANISRIYQLPFKVMNNKFDGLSFKERIVSTHGQLKMLATTLYKIANDVRFLGSGPRAGIGELILPANEPGSSIMPGKVNPTQSEAMMMVCAQVFGNDVTISFAASQGNYELNTFMPVIAYDALWSVQLLNDAIQSFNQKCVKGIEVNYDRIKLNLENSLMLVTALSPKIGYAKAAEIAKYAYKHNTTLKKAALTLGYISEIDFDKLINVRKMV